jgi:hypothetical protein
MIPTFLVPDTFEDSIMEFSMQSAAPASQFQLQDPISLSAEPFLQIYSLLMLSRILSTWEVNPSATDVSSLYLGYLLLSLRATYGDKDVLVKICESYHGEGHRMLKLASRLGFSFVTESKGCNDGHHGTVESSGRISSL